VLRIVRIVSLAEESTGADCAGLLSRSAIVASVLLVHLSRCWYRVAACAGEETVLCGIVGAWSLIHCECAVLPMY
jgi:hypothetical protein